MNFSDDSGIEDSWNDESSNMPSVTNNQSNQGESNDDLTANPVVSDVPYKSFTPLTPPKDQYMPMYGPVNIYPTVSPESEALFIRTDIKGKFACKRVLFSSF